MSTDQSDQTLAARMAAGLAILAILALALLIWGVIAMLPAFSSWVDSTFSSGLGLKQSGLVAAVVSVVVIIVFAIFAGDGLIGEIQFMIPGFFIFFVFFWLGLAWIF